MKDGNLTEFNEGGTHSQNPLGGIPMGQGANVEQGETKKDNFVFSNRFTLTPELVKQFGLPKSLVGKTPADASKSVDKKFDGRNDKISTSTKNNMLSKIGTAQETLKAIEQAKIAKSMQANSTEVPDMMNGQVPEGVQMFMGGEMSGNEDSQDKDLSQNQQAGIAGSAGLAGGLASGDLKSGLQDGASAAANVYFPGSGPVAGAVVGGLYDLGNSLLTKDDNDLRRNNAIAASNKFGNDFAVGGYIGDPNFVPSVEAQGNPIMNLQSIVGAKPDGIFGPKSKKALSDWQTLKGISSDGQIGPETYKTAGLDPNGYKPYDVTAPTSLPNPNGREGDPVANRYAITGEEQPGESPLDYKKIAGYDTAGKKPNWLENNYGNIMRYAPVAANAYQLATLDKPKNEHLNRLDQRFKPDYVDERSLQNVVGNEYDNTVNAISSMGGGEGATRNAILGAGLNKSKALGNAYMEASNQNRNQNLQGQQFNLGVNQANISQSNLELDINDRNKANYETQKSKLIGALGENVGDIGKEEVYKKMAKEMFGYKWNGDYWVKPDGSMITDEQAKAEVLSGGTPTKKALGGYMLNKKGK